MFSLTTLHVTFLFSMGVTGRRKAWSCSWLWDRPATPEDSRSLARSKHILGRVSLSHCAVVLAWASGKSHCKMAQYNPCCNRIESNRHSVKNCLDPTPNSVKVHYGKLDRFSVSLIMIFCDMNDTITMKSLCTSRAHLYPGRQRESRHFLNNILRNSVSIK